MNNIMARPPRLSSLEPNTSSTYSASKELQSYKQNMKVFMQKVQAQLSTVTKSYQSKVAKLLNQNRQLKARLSKYEDVSQIKNSAINDIGGKTIQSKFQGQTKSTNFYQSPKSKQRQKKQKKHIFGHNITNKNIDRDLENLSQIFSPIKREKNPRITSSKKEEMNFDSFPSLLMEEMAKNSMGLEELNSKMFQSNAFKTNQKYKFQVENSCDNMAKSKFERVSSKKKQKQENIINSLEMGKNNLDLNTTKMFSLLGREPATNPEIEEGNDPKKNDSGNLKRKVSISDPMNTSLSSLCDSLNNSFHAKKAQAKNKKKKQKLQKKEEEQQGKKKQQQQFVKEQGIKNLLKSLRSNIEHSAERPPQIIRSSKLLVTGNNNKSKSVSRSKVMINPVPVNLQKRNTANQSKIFSTSSPQKKPQSILKNSSNILGGTIANISAISFYESGGED